MGRKVIRMNTKNKTIVLSEVGLSKTVIAQRCNVSRICIIHTIRKYNEEHTVSTKIGADRPSKLTVRQKYAIELEQLRDDTLLLNDLDKYTQAYLGVKIGRSTISSILNDQLCCIEKTKNNTDPTKKLSYLVL